METIAIAEFRANLLQILERIEAGASFTITSNGREIAQLFPPNNKKQPKTPRTLAELRKTAIVGDILSPIGEEWDADK